MYDDPLAFLRPNWPPLVGRACDALGATKLEPHLHEALLACALYSAIYALSPVLSPRFVSQYRQLSLKTRLDFDTRVVSQIQAVVLCALSYPMFSHPDLVYGPESYIPYGGFVAAMAIGYFLWDTYVSVRRYKLFGWSFVLHGAAALYTFVNALCPFLMPYGAVFMWFEASTPFVNIHWLSTHVPNMVSPKWQTANGILLIITFFVFRIVNGSYNGFLIIRELLTDPPRHVPIITQVGVMSCYLSLMYLNFLWFSKMISLALKRMKPKGTQ